MHVVLVLASLSGYSVGSKSSPSQLEIQIEQAPKSAVTPDIKQRSNALHGFLIGQLAYGREDYQQAMQQFKGASELMPEPVAIIHTRLAELHLRQGHLPEALKESEKALMAEPDSVQNQLLRAGILEAMGRTDEALGMYKQVADKNLELVEAHVLLASLYEDRGELDKGILVLREFAKRKPNEAIVLYYIGRAREKQGDFSDAEIHYRKVLALPRQNIDPGPDLIRVLIKKRDMAGVKAVCEKLLADNPGHIVARRVLGEVLAGENRFDEALEHLKVVEQSSGDPLSTRFKIAQIQFQKQNYPEAIRELNLILAQDPKNVEARYQLGSIYAATGRVDEAVDELVKIEPGQGLYAKAHTFAAFLARQKGDLKKSESLVREVIDSGQDDKATISFLILVLREAKKYREAVKVTQEALEQDPNNEALLYTLSGLLHDLGKDDESLAVMEKLLQINPKHPEALNGVAYSLAERGRDLERATDLVNRALAIRPNEGFFVDTLGWIYFRQGKLDEAENTIKRALSLAGQDPEILEHYGDVLLARGASKEALEQYRGALEKLREDNALSPETRSTSERRLEEKIRKLSDSAS